jgi:hypothetical protein
MQDNTEKISIDTAAGKFLFFFPKSEEEAEQAFARLLKAGFRIGEGYDTPLTAENAVEKGIGVLEDKIFCNPNRSYRKAPRGNWLCAVDQLDEDYLPADQRFMLDLFNKLGARLDRIEQRLDGIEAATAPARMDKKPLRRPEEKHGR